MKIQSEKNNLYFMLIVDVSASSEAFVETVCLIAVRRSFSGRTACRRCGRVGRTLISVHRRVLLLPDVYGLLDPSVHSVASPVDDFGLILIYDVVERDSMICFNEGFSGSRNVNNHHKIKVVFLIEFSFC